MSLWLLNGWMDQFGVNSTGSPIQTNHTSFRSFLSHFSIQPAGRQVFIRIQTSSCLIFLSMRHISSQFRFRQQNRTLVQSKIRKYASSCRPREKLVGKHINDNVPGSPAWKYEASEGFPLLWGLLFGPNSVIYANL